MTEPKKVAPSASKTRTPAKPERKRAESLPAPAANLSSMRRALWVAAVVIAAAGAITTRVVVSGEGEISESTAALDRGDAHDATVHARRAAGWYVPGAPHVAVAYERLRALAEGAEAHRRYDLALLAWRAIRSSSLQTRWLLTPHKQDAAYAERQIARLAAQSKDGLTVDSEELQAQLRSLARRPGPSQTWSVVLVGAFALALVSLVWATRRLAGAAGKLQWKQARVPLAFTAVAAAMWLLAMWQA